jgi:nucleotide-binding universal stress UspA family protein
MISKILVPIDGSKVSHKAARYAVELAKQIGASLTLLSVFDIRLIFNLEVSASASPTDFKKSIEDYLEQSAKSSISEITKLCERNRVHHNSVIRRGHVVEEILNEARKTKADLIVIGSHGKSSIKAAILGSVTYGVVHKDMKIPVLIVRR